MLKCEGQVYLSSYARLISRLSVCACALPSRRRWLQVAPASYGHVVLTVGAAALDLHPCTSVSLDTYVPRKYLLA